PYCNAQLRAFQRDAEKLDGLDLRVVSLSVDDEATARELIAKHGLTFPVGHSADAAAIHEATGAFVNADPVHLQSTRFVLAPDGNVAGESLGHRISGPRWPRSLATRKSVFATHKGHACPREPKPVPCPSRAQEGPSPPRPPGPSARQRRSAALARMERGNPTVSRR